VAGCRFARAFPSVAVALQAVAVRRSDWSVNEHQQLLNRLRSLEEGQEAGHVPDAVDDRLRA
jgi:hypothetical protein